MSDLAHKTALVTGGGSGINLKLAKALRDKGCAVLIADISLTPAAATWLKSLGDQVNPRVVFHKTDVTSLKQLAKVFEVFDKQIGGVPDIVVPGAGVYEGSFPGFWDDKDETLNYRLFDINILHPIRMTRIAIRKMREAKKSGTILHLSSITAQKPSVVLPLYAVSKAAISQFVRCMAPLNEMCGIRVVGIAPGLVDTPLLRNNSGSQNHVDPSQDFLLPPEEVVMAMMALLTEAKYTGGTVIEVGDIGSWREVHILGDAGPQGRSTRARAKTSDATAKLAKMLLGDETNVSGPSKL
ncbi:15-hydroxyprostaglandin dehydrogenase [Fusarium tjaetaba]|uniref:15-hydroxyprostaglandin dehydrogenase n=1 Tax=Fusarium tjaetaba TaxID=1567544 RepID=A0A8H5RGU9_9HYPO|nr:15-hydroxyprostaglandin dehydrogenase [Fusarium tjaetaba]KAF5632272.1 15-hydroxyprostaglandin dehydrogenase [Fusarium tjaetaba]